MMTISGHEDRRLGVPYSGRRVQILTHTATERLVQCLRPPLFSPQRRRPPEEELLCQPLLWGKAAEGRQTAVEHT